MIFLIIILYIIAGFGLITVLDLRFSIYQKLSLSLILGMGIGSLVPYILTVLGIFINPVSIIVLTGIFALIPNGHLLYKKESN